MVGASVIPSDVLHGHGARGGERIQPSITGKDAVWLIRHGGGADVTNGTDVMLKHLPSGEIQIRTRTGSGVYSFVGIANQKFTYDAGYTHTFSGSKTFTEHFGSNAPTDLPSEVTSRVKSVGAHYEVQTRSNAR